MYELDTNFENQLAREHERQSKCCHSYLKCGFCGMCKDNLNNIYKQEIDRLRQILKDNNIAYEIQVI